MKLLSRVAVIITALGVVLALFLGYLFGFSDLQAQRSQQLLFKEFPSRGDPPTQGTRAILAGRTPAQGQPAAVLRIPALHVRDVVVEGTSAGDLQKGPGLMPGTPPPGVRGNTVIAGHRLTYGAPFAHLLALMPGDRIVLTSSFGTFTYRVAYAGVALPGAADPVEPSTRAEVTLVTGDVVQQGREFVTADLVGRPIAQPRYDVSRPKSELALAGDSAAVMPAIFWGVALLAAIGVAFVAFRRWSHPALVYLFTMPTLLALAIETFGEAARLLPPTL